MDTLPAVFKACLLYLSLFTRLAFSESPTVVEKCPQHQGTDPSDVNERVQKFAGQDIYYTDDDEYKYKIEICQKNLESVAVQQLGKKWTSDKSWVNVGTYDGAHVTGGTDWLMIKYLHGKAYTHHCNNIERLAVVLITCDPGEQRGTVNIIEEYRNSTTDSRGNRVPLECYYLFELNHDAACSVSTSVSAQTRAQTLALIIVVVVEAVLILLIFLYFGFKQLRQNPRGSRTGFVILPTRPEV